jgi:protein TonB
MSTSGAYVVSVAVHASLAAALGVLPLLSEAALPEQATAVIDSVPFFVLPLPPPPPGGDPVSLVRNRPPRVAPPFPTSVAPAPSLADVDELPIDDSTGDLVLGTTGDEGDPRGLGNTIGGVFADTSATPPPAPTVVRITSGLTAPRVVRRVEPVYPALALAAHATATVLLEAEVDPRGNVTRVSVLHGHPLFDAAAIEAVERWRYQPLLLNGVPTAFVLTVTVHFGLR